MSGCPEARRTVHLAGIRTGPGHGGIPISIRRITALASVRSLTRPIPISVPMPARHSVTMARILGIATVARGGEALAGTGVDQPMIPSETC